MKDFNAQGPVHSASPSPAASSASPSGDTVAGIYIASKTKHGAWWRALRGSGAPIISTWIDEAEVGATSNWPDLWSRCVREASQAAATIVYREEGEVLKGAFVEMGAALAAGRIVFTVGCDEFSVRHHMRVVSCASLEEALELAHEHLAALASDATPAPTSGSEDGGEINAAQITMGRGLVDVSRINHEGRSGILFRPRGRHIPVGEEGELQPGKYWPVAGDVVIWIENEDGAAVIRDYLAPFLAKAASEPAGGDVAGSDEFHFDFTVWDPHGEFQITHRPRVPQATVDEIRAAALSSSAAPAVELVANDAPINLAAQAIAKRRDAWKPGERIAPDYLKDASAAVDAYLKAAHPVPVTVEMRESAGRDKLVEMALTRFLPLVRSATGSEDVPVPADDFAVILGLLKASLPNQASAVEAAYERAIQSTEHAYRKNKSRSWVMTILRERLAVELAALAPATEGRKS